MTKWYENTSTNDSEISGQMVLDKAKEFAKQLNIHDFEPNQGWLQRWKRNEKITLKKSSRETSSNDTDFSDSFLQNAPLNNDDGDNNDDADNNDADNDDGENNDDKNNDAKNNDGQDVSTADVTKPKENENGDHVENTSSNSSVSSKDDIKEIKNKTICRVCLQSAKCALNIFDRNGMQLNIAEIILQHFWFKPIPGDPISTVICRECWVQVNDFHEFYVRVEHAHEVLNDTTMSEDNVKDENSDILGALLNVEVSIKKEASDESDMNPLYEPEVPDIIAEINENETNEDKIASTSTKAEDQLNAKNVTDNANNKNDNNVKMNVAEEGEDEAGADKAENDEESEVDNDEVSNYADESSDEVQEPPKKKPCKKRTKSAPKKKAKAVPTEKKKKNEDRIKWIESKQKDEEMIKKHIAMGCDLCTFVGDNFADMTQHFREAHPTLRPYVKCCDRKLNRRLVAQHAYKHEDPNFFWCAECQRSFSNKYTLNFHNMSNHAPEEQLIFSCDKCPRRFPRKYLLDIHTPSHIPMEEREFMCEQCPGKAFASKYLLQIHVSMQHKKAINVCHVCAKSIRHNQDFEKHVRAHFEESGPRLKCPRPDCDHWLKDEENLKRHMRRHEEEGKIFICPECGKSCKNSRSLVSHIHYSHSKAVFECEVCQKQFKRAITLKEHMAQHTGQTLYKCPFCERTFNSNANMHSHKKKMHPVEWEHWRRTKSCSSQQVLPS